MYSNVIMTGFGGQGVQMISQLLVVSSINKGYEVTYLPSYGVEKRGGRTDVTVVMADEEIGSPITNVPYILIAMDTIGLNFYQKMVKPEGIIIANTSLITSDNFNRDDLDIVKIDSNDEALKLGHSRYANMILLGAYLKKIDFLDFEDLEKNIADVLPDRFAHTIPDNLKAIKRGFELA